MSDGTAIRWWCGTEDDEHRARLELCAERRAQWGDDDCDHDHDGSCFECTSDLPEKLPCPRRGCPHHGELEPAR